jgi:hypothetical protein
MQVGIRSCTQASTIEWVRDVRLDHATLSAGTQTTQCRTVHQSVALWR